MPFRSRRPKSRSYLIKVSARSSTDQLDFVLSLPVRTVAETTGRGAQLTRTRAVLSAVSNTNLRAVPVGHRPCVLLGTCKLRPHSGAMSARDWDVMQENVQLDKNGGAIAQARREGETRAHVLGVRAHLARSPKTRRNGEAPRKRPVRETSERCERWQLPPSQSPCKRCRKVSSLFY